MKDNDIYQCAVRSENSLIIDSSLFLMRNEEVYPIAACTDLEEHEYKYIILCHCHSSIQMACAWLR